MKDKVRMAVIGTSGRGCGHTHALTNMDDVEVVAVCDLYEDRAARALQICDDKYQGSVKVEAYTDYRRLLERRDIDAVVIASSWNSHGYLAVAAMESGKYAAVECGGAASIDECWQIVRTYERTGNHCMFLENCCYDRAEMTVLRMIKDGIFGEVVHVEGGYQHELREEIAFGPENRHYRFSNFMNRNGEVYPAHALGPMQKYLNINRGNRMLTLTSTASKARGLHEYIVEKKGADHPDARRVVTQGDVVTTVIKCAHGETIVLYHSCTTPHPYSRRGRVQGTRGIWTEDNKSIYIEGLSPEHDTWEPFSKYLNDPKYEHPLWTWFRDSNIQGGHGGMDYLVLRAYVESVRDRVAPPLDAYDGACLMAITPLSENSIAMGGAPQPIPDFTDGKWINREPSPKSRYNLDEIDLSLF
ncbi:MAG: Gfo/Idh/MocA family oxidoreductase [Clostridiales bacterium]|nr:Gfo/Idh/MocA family oxidoreductase [Clostridiales bacterium]